MHRLLSRRASNIKSPFSLVKHGRSRFVVPRSSSNQTQYSQFGHARLSALLTTAVDAVSKKSDPFLHVDNSIVSNMSNIQRTPSPAVAVPLVRKQEKIISLERKASSVNVLFCDGTSSEFHNAWLFRTCPCPSCKQPHSGQSLRSPEQLPTNPQIKNIWLEHDGTDLIIDWQESDGVSHKSRISALFLRNNRYDEAQIIQKRLNASPNTLTRACEIPRVDFERVMNDELTLCEWLNYLADYGVAVVSNASVQPKTVAKLASRIGVVMHTIYGETWQVRAEETPINIAYSTVGLGLHQDLVYYESPPALQFLHCLRFDPEVSGGESTLMDFFAVCEYFRSLNPKAFQALCELPATFQKIHYQRESPVHIVNRRPHIWTCPQNGDVIGGLWAPPFEGLPVLPFEQMQRYLEAYASFASIIEDPSSPLRITLKLQPGEILTFSNRRMLHGRNAFVQEPKAIRHLEGCYVAAEEFINSLQRTNLKLHGKCNDTVLMMGNHVP